MKKHHILSALFLIVGIFVMALLIFFENQIFVFSADNSSEEKKSIPTECPEDLEDLKDNEYYQEAFDEEKNTFSQQKAIDLFLENQDSEFDDYIDLFSGASLTCGLSRLGTEAMQKKKSTEEFAEERLSDLQKINCALFRIYEHSSRISCSGEGSENNITTREDALSCNRSSKSKINQQKEYLVNTMQIALENLDEMILSYPLHKQLECVHEGLIEQREKMIKILRIYAPIQASLVNASSE